MATTDKDAIGAAIGFGGMAACIAIVYAGGLWTRYAPDVRDFLLWAITPQFAMGMFTMAGLGALVVVAVIWGDKSCIRR